MLAPICHDSKLLWDISQDFLDIVQDDPQSDPSLALSELLQGAVQAHPACLGQMAGAISQVSIELRMSLGANRDSK